MIYESNYYNSGYAILVIATPNQDKIKYFDLQNISEDISSIKIAPIQVGQDN